MEAPRRNLPVVAVDRQVPAEFEGWLALSKDALKTICERLEYRDVRAIGFVHTQWQNYLHELGLLPKQVKFPGTRESLPVEYLSLLRLSPLTLTDNPSTFFLTLVKRSLHSRVIRRVSLSTGEEVTTHHQQRPIKLSRYRPKELASVYLVGDYPAAVIKTPRGEFVMVIGGGGRGIMAVYLCDGDPRWHNLLSDVDIIRVITHQGKVFCEEATGGVVIVDEWLRVVRLPNPYYKNHSSPPASIVVESGAQLLWVAPILQEEGTTRQYVIFSLDQEAADPPPRWIRLKVLSRLTTSVAIIFHRITVCIPGLQEARISRGLVVLATMYNEFVLSRDNHLLRSKWLYLVHPDPAWLKPHDERARTKEEQPAEAEEQTIC